MSLRLGSLRLFVGYELAAALAAVLILDRDDRYVCCFIAAAAHELGHIVTARCFGVRVRAISLRLFDVLIEADSPKSYAADMCITLGGAAANLVLAAVFAPVWGLFSTANLALACFNLLPVASLDGGRFLALLLSRRLSPRAAERALCIISFLILLPMLTAGIYVLLRSEYNYSLLIVSLYLSALLLLKKQR